MRAIRSKGMKPELAVRRLVHSMGYRYRLHRHDLPGRPDLVFPGRHQGDLRTRMFLAPTPGSALQVGPPAEIES